MQAAAASAAEFVTQRAVEAAVALVVSAAAVAQSSPSSVGFQRRGHQSWVADKERWLHTLPQKLRISRRLERVGVVG